MTRVIPENLIKIEDNRIPNPLINTSEINDFTYENIKSNNDESLKQKLFDKVCKNISFVYTYPINQDTNIDIVNWFPLGNYKKELPLKPSARIGIRSDNLKQYFYDDKNKSITSEDRDISNDLCNETKINDLKNTFYLKLKLLVYLRSVLNLQEDEDNNKWENIYKKAKSTKNNQQNNKLTSITTQLQEWYKYIKNIFEDVKKDNVDNKKLEEYIKAFELSDSKTKDLCNKIIDACDIKETISNDDKNKICNQNINIYSVTKDICKEVQTIPSIQSSQSGQTIPSTRSGQTIPSIQSSQSSQTIPSIQSKKDPLKNLEKSKSTGNLFNYINKPLPIPPAKYTCLGNENLYKDIEIFMKDKTLNEYDRGKLNDIKKYLIENVKQKINKK
jgi:hypothetical protein